MVERRSILDTKNNRVLNFPLTVPQQVWLSFLFPALIEALFYILDLGTDIAIGVALLQEGLLLPGLLTLFFMYLPPLVCFINTISTPSENTKGWKAICKSILIEFLAFILFPIRPIQSFSERIFWGIEAVRHDDPEKEEALVEYEKARALYIDHYMFFQAFVHAGPQLILQLSLIVLSISTVHTTVVMQGMCMITSVGSLALVTASYQRYESQCKGGRKRVWKKEDEEMAKQKLLEQKAEGGEEADGERGGLSIPNRVRWTKVMEPDDPIGKILAFCYWFLLLFGRCLCLVVAASFIPYAVLGVCIGHYIFSFLYILPSPQCKSSIPLKMLLGILYIFCLIEVGVKFRKSYLLYGLFFSSYFIENFVLTMVWVFACHWDGYWYPYVLSVLLMTHVLGLLLAILYVQFFRPITTRMKPNT